MKFPAACVNDIITWDFKQNIEIHADKLSLVQPLNCQSLSHYIESGGRKSLETTIGFRTAMVSAKLGNACAIPYTHTHAFLVTDGSTRVNYFRKLSANKTRRRRVRGAATETVFFLL